MSLVIRRLDFTNTINAMLCCTARHALLSDGQRQQALDDLTAALNNVASIITRNNLSRQLDGPIPPVPPRHQVDEDETDVDLDEDADIEVDIENPDAYGGPESSLTPTQGRLLAYIRSHPGCTVVEMRKALQIGNATISTHLGAIRRAGIPIVAKGKPANYYEGKRAA